MLVGQSIGPFLIEKELGSGAMGTVFRARYEGKDARFLKELGQENRVALKVIAFGLAGNETALARFEREAKILKQLRHPHIVRLMATGRWRDTPFFAMEYVDGQSLDRIMVRRDRFSWEEVVQLGQQLCEALQHAHDKGIIHRDLKPSNLMMAKDGTLKLTDFGIAKDIDLTALTGANNTIGTAAYMSPEQCKGEKTLSAKSDLYSLGVVFYELLTGRKPFIAESAVDMFLLHVQGTFTRPSQLVADIPIWLDTLVVQLMEKDPTQRPLNAAMVAKALSDIADKVATQKSAGEEVAKARMVDRVHLTAVPDETDREASRAIKAGAKKKKLKKKKGAPFYRKGWFTAIAAILLVAAIGFAIHLVLKPDSPETMIQRIKDARSPETRATLIASYLKAHGDLKDKDTEWVRSLDRAEKVHKREAQLLKRFQFPNLKSEPEDDDPEAYRAAMAALDAEADGDLRAAAERWKALADRFNGDSDPKKALAGWVGAKKYDDIKLWGWDENKVPPRQAELYKALEDARLDDRDFKPASEEQGDAVRAIRFEQLGDSTKARDAWSKLKEKWSKSVDQRTWFLIATGHERELAAMPLLKEDERVKLVANKLMEARAFAADTGDRVKARSARNICRDIRDLYGGDVSTFKPLVADAEKLLAELSKK